MENFKSLNGQTYSEKAVRQAMSVEAKYESSATHIAENVADELDLYLDDEEYTIPERLFELALDYGEEG